MLKNCLICSKSTINHIQILYHFKIYLHRAVAAIWYIFIDEYFVYTVIIYHKLHLLHIIDSALHVQI